MGNSCCGARSSCGCDVNKENKMCALTKPRNQFDMEKIIPLVDDSKYVCSCCGRLANNAENLCKPVELKK